MATCDFQGGCQNEVRIPKSFSGPSACRHYRFCSLPRPAMSRYPAGQGVWRTTHKAVITWKVQLDSEDKPRILLKENGFRSSGFPPSLRIARCSGDSARVWKWKLTFVLYWKLGMSLTIDQVGFLWVPCVWTRKKSETFRGIVYFWMTQSPRCLLGSIKNISFAFSPLDSPCSECAKLLAVEICLCVGFLDTRTSISLNFDMWIYSSIVSNSHRNYFRMATFLSLLTNLKFSA